MPIDLDKLTELYRRGSSMQAIADHYGVSRELIRRRLVAAGEPTRSVGRPRLAVSNDDVAALRDAGYQWNEVAERLGIQPAAARTRYYEVLARRGARTDGPWHIVLLNAVQSSASVPVLEIATSYLGRPPSRTEAHAVRRAARDLAYAGRIHLARESRIWNGTRARKQCMIAGGIQSPVMPVILSSWTTGFT